MKFLVVFFLLINVSPLFCQQVDTAINVETVIDSILVGSGIRTGNVKLIGARSSICSFRDSSRVIGMSEGLLLSTGNVFDVFKKNSSPANSTATIFEPSQHDSRIRRTYLKSGDKHLNRLSGGKTTDVISIEFDFIAYHDSIEFFIVFGSEEYPEYVGSPFNDVFGFFIWGKNKKTENLAKINEDIIISVNSLNHINSRQLYIDNNIFVNFGLGKSGLKLKTSFWTKLKLKIAFLFMSATQKKEYLSGFFTDSTLYHKIDSSLVNSIEFDGVSKKLKIKHAVNPYTKYHLKIALADVGDAIFDSGIFIEKGSFNSYGGGIAMDSSIVLSQSEIDSILGISRRPDSVTSYRDCTDLSVSLQRHVDYDSLYSRTIVYFGNSSSIIKDTKVLDSLCKFLLLKKRVSIVVKGYTDINGSIDYNFTLSKSRAQSVRDYIVSKGVDANRIKLGKSDYLKPFNEDEQDFVNNRRVEIEVVCKKWGLHDTTPNFK